MAPVSLPLFFLLLILPFKGHAIFWSLFLRFVVLLVLFNPTVQMCRSLYLRGWAPLPTDMTLRANKHLKLHIRKLDSIASWHSRKWPFHAQIRGFTKMNTQSNTEEDGLKMPPAEHMHSTQASSGTFYIYCCTCSGLLRHPFMTSN